MKGDPMSATPIDAVRPAWKEPLVWMVVGIPAATVVAGLTTWWIAAQRADSNVYEDWYKRGLTINRSLERESRAEALRMRAEISLADEHDLRVRLESDATLPPTVTVVLTHPVRAELDRRLSLERQTDGVYRTVSPLAGAGRWGLAIEAEDWRIAARHVTLSQGATVRVTPDGKVD
jgi:hypothetical protein